MDNSQAPLFDFTFFLSSVDPSQQYTIQSLTGGIINVTVRATKLPASNGANRGRFPDQDTLILKYAPPLIAGVGEAAPFSIYRQVCEAHSFISL